MAFYCSAEAKERSVSMELKIEHLSKQFKDKTAVNDVDLTLTPGVWGLLGANGAGMWNFLFIHRRTEGYQ